MEKGTIKLAIADDEPLICSMLSGIIRFDELGLALCGCVYDGNALLELIEKERPDIVITDICMPGMEGLEVIRICSQRGYACRFIVISGYRQFDYAYNAMKYDVEDYLLKPIDEKELHEVLAKLARQLCEDDKISYKSSAQMLRNFFMKKALYELEAHQLGRKVVNATYGTQFEKGVYRFFWIKFYHSDEAGQTPGSLLTFLDRAEEAADRFLRPACYELLTDKRPDRVGILANYDPGRETEIRELLGEILKRMKGITDRFFGVYVNIGVGEACGELAGAVNSGKEALAALWSLLFSGCGQAAFYEEKGSGEGPYYEKLRELGKEMEEAFQNLNTAGFRKSAKDFFALPRQVLKSREAHELLVRLQEEFFDSHSELCGGGTDLDSMEQRIQEEIWMAGTIEEYIRAFQEGFSEIMDWLLALAHSRNLRPVRQALSYIEEHYAGELTQEQTAKEVGLSRVYFSKIFKEDVGQGFSEYVTEFRIKKAKELLKHSNKNMMEIADAVGFKDAKYFGRIFKKNTGVTPLEYRKIYG